MKLLQKASALLLCVVMLLGLLPVSAFAVGEAYQFRIVADKTEVNPGDEVKFTVTVAGTEECDQFGLMFKFDANVFELVRGVAQASYENEDGKEMVDVKIFNKNAGKEGIAVSFLESVVYSGKVGYITLKVKENAKFTDTVFGAELAVNNGATKVSAAANTVKISMIPAETEAPTVAPTTAPTEPAGNAAYQFKIVADKTEVNPGDEVKFTVTVEGTEPCDQFGIMFKFDAKVFELVKGAAQATILDEYEEELVGVKSFNKNAGKEGIAVSFLESVVYSGKVGYITLKVKDNANFAETVFGAEMAVNNGTKKVSASVNDVTIYGALLTCEVDNVIWGYTLQGNGAVLCSCDAGDARDITVPSVIDGYPVTAIAAGVFLKCTGIQKIILPESITSIPDAAFSGCTELTAVTIPAGITFIGDTFDSCGKLENVYYAGAKLQWNAIRFSNTSANLTNATIHYNHTHDYTLLPPVVVPATCTQAGYTEYYCAYDIEDTYRQYVPALGHDISTTAVTVQPTCTQGGYAEFRCSRCDEAAATDHVPALGHEYSRLVEKIAPTCTEGGYSIMGCIRCEEQIIADYMDALGHDYSRLVEKVEPTCTEDGYSVKGCCRCEETVTTDYVPALGHHAVLIPMKDATCTEDGISRPGTMCDRCLVILVQPTVAPALGHDFVNGACSRCGDKDPNYFTADLNEDTLVDNGDVLTLLWHTLFPEQNPIAAPVDFNTDGKVDNDDVLTLLWHTLFPEQNPLGPPSITGIWVGTQLAGECLNDINVDFDNMFLRCRFGVNLDVLDPEFREILLAEYANGSEYVCLFDNAYYYFGSGDGGSITYTVEGSSIYVNCQDAIFLTIEKISEDQMLIVQSNIVDEHSNCLQSVNLYYTR